LTGVGADEQQQQQQGTEDSSSSDADDETKVDWNTHTVVVLKAELKKRGIPTPTKARKAELVKILTESDETDAMDMD
jgi:hypothetical protein